MNHCTTCNASHTNTVDGDQWCALYGDDLQSGVAGFGDSPELAMQDFDAAFRKPLKEPTHE